jgi:hypothetical protein
VVPERSPETRTKYFGFEVPICFRLVVRKHFVLAQNHRLSNKVASPSFRITLGPTNLDANVLVDVEKTYRKRLPRKRKWST